MIISATEEEKESQKRKRLKDSKREQRIEDSKREQRRKNFGHVQTPSAIFFTLYPSVAIYCHILSVSLVPAYCP